MIYVDCSCLLKLLLEEPESEAVRQAVAAEDDVVVSVLVELEARVQLRAGRLGGKLRPGRYRGYVAQLDAFRKTEPFRFVTLPGTVFLTAIQQHQAARNRHVRSLDQLHLAAMAELRLRRLMTTDAVQAAGARLLGFDVVIPASA